MNSNGTRDEQLMEAENKTTVTEHTQPGNEIMYAKKICYHEMSVSTQCAVLNILHKCGSKT